MHPLTPPYAQDRAFDYGDVHFVHSELIGSISAEPGTYTWIHASLMPSRSLRALRPSGVRPVRKDCKACFIFLAPYGDQSMVLVLAFLQGSVKSMVPLDFVQSGIEEAELFRQLIFDDG